MLMKVKPVQIDFFYVEPAHKQMDIRLVNWGKSQFSGFGNSASGVFRFVKPSQQWDAIETTIPVDRHDAMLIGKGVAALPQPHALALSWCYVRKTSPKKGCELLKTNMEGLYRYIRDARTMLINRKV